MNNENNENNENNKNNVIENIDKINRNNNKKNNDEVEILDQNSINMRLYHRQEKKCYICNCEMLLNEEDICQTPCDHLYHYECLYFTFIENEKNINRQDYEIRECPYCRINIRNYMPPYKLDEYPIAEYIHKNTNLYRCYAILKSGKKKGNYCNCWNNHPKSKYCGRHKNYISPVNTDTTNLYKLIKFNK